MFSRWRLSVCERRPGLPDPDWDVGPGLVGHRQVNTLHLSTSVISRADHLLKMAANLNIHFVLLRFYSEGVGILGVATVGIVGCFLSFR